jgi:lipoyl(octanoyl) transferase
MNQILNKQTQFIHLGLKDYKDAWDYQTSLFNSILEVKAANRALPEDQQTRTNNYLLFCEHPHVYTLGKSGKENNLLVNTEELSSIGATYYHINRGGDITYHGPGQLVCYPVIDLENFFTDIHKYMRLLEESVILTLKEFNIDASRIPGLTGVWLDVENQTTARKICAMGVKSSRWAMMHGLALNVNCDLNYFGNIIACGIEDKSVTSMKKELACEIDMMKVEAILKKHIGEQFGMEWL